MTCNLVILCVTLILLCLSLSQVQGRPFSAISIEENGQVYDCVNFHKQPAFSHPLLNPSLKNISFNARSKIPAIEESRSRAKEIGLKNGGCPSGTVPILRIADFGDDPPPPPPPPEARCSAVVYTSDFGKKFQGAYGAISLHKPQQVEMPGQWSSSRVKLKNGPESIEAGWIVFPDLFKDYEAHLYAKFSVGQNECINTQCEGFVQVSKDVPLGYIPKNYGSFMGQQYYWNVTIEKHQDDGNWWLAVIGKEKYEIGYWPRLLFSGLENFATEVNWGGEIESPRPNYPPPSMGNGVKAVYDTSRAAYVQHITVIDESFQSVNPEHTLKSKNCPKQYTVLDFGYKGGYWGHTLVFGGPKEGE